MSEYEIPRGKRRLSIKGVCIRYGTDGKPLNPATIYRAMRKKSHPFPQPDKINGCNSWPEEILDHYDDELRADAESRAAA